MGLGETHAEGVEFGEEPPASRHRGKRLKRRTLQNHPVYAAMIENLDHNIGRLLETIDDNTLVIFTSDNGGFIHLARSRRHLQRTTQRRQRLDG